MATTSSTPALTQDSCITGKSWLTQIPAAHTRRKAEQRS
nr:MAG TPA_asm: hypothetical protein [Bacteriophage sp.]